jgi:hypothetical protein
MGLPSVGRSVTAAARFQFRREGDPWMPDGDDRRPACL